MEKLRILRRLVSLLPLLPVSHPCLYLGYLLCLRLCPCLLCLYFVRIFYGLSAIPVFRSSALSASSVTRLLSMPHPLYFRLPSSMARLLFVPRLLRQRLKWLIPSVSSMAHSFYVLCSLFAVFASSAPSASVFCGSPVVCVLSTPSTSSVTRFVCVFCGSSAMCASSIPSASSVFCSSSAVCTSSTPSVSSVTCFIYVFCSSSY